MVPVRTEHSSVWPCLNHSCSFSSLEEDKEQEGHTERQLLSLLNLGSVIYFDYDSIKSYEEMLPNAPKARHRFKTT